MQTFKVTGNHLKLLSKLKFSWNTEGFGAPMVDPKKPFGNEDVVRDFAQILCIDVPDKEKSPTKHAQFVESLKKGYRQIEICLKILCKDGFIGFCEYESEDGENWVRKRPK